MRRAVAEALGSVGPNEPQVVAALLQALRDESMSMRQTAAEALGQRGEGELQVVAALLNVLHEDKVVWVREAATLALGQLKIKEDVRLHHVLVALNQCVHDWDGPVREAARKSIRTLLDGRSIPYYQWVPLREQQRRQSQWRQKVKDVFVVLGIVIAFLLTLLGGTVWFTGDPASILGRVLTLVGAVSALIQTGILVYKHWVHRRKKQNTEE